MRRSCSNGGEKINTEEGEILLDDMISFDDDIFDDIILPDLEIDPDDIFADFSFCSGEESSGNSIAVADSAAGAGATVLLQVPDSNNKEEEEEEYGELSHNEVVSGRSKEEEEDGSLLLVSAPSSGGSRSAAGRKLSTTAAAAAATKGSHGKKKKKTKVDWSPELHRRFVQAVEQLGVDKAVPSRILQLMGGDYCLTRHNIASHLQKYRSHRKHLLAREAEAASWSQRRHMYAAAGTVVMKNRPLLDMKKPSDWQAPPMVGFPPPPPHQQITRPLIRPLHVWGHPSVADRPQLVPVWPRHLSAPQPWLPSRPPVVVGQPPPMPHDPNSLWHSHYQMALTQGMPCFPPAHQLVPNMMFQAHDLAVPGIHPHPLFRSNNAAAATAAPTPTSEHSAAFYNHPSNEKIDAAIGDVLAKPWSPLPLGLKPPSLESVMVELQRQGVGKVPP